MKTLLSMLVILASSSLAWADIGYDFCFADFLNEEAAGASVFVAPDGSGTPLTEAFTFGGGLVDATIVVTLLDVVGNPVEGYPGDDIWLVTDDGGLVTCDFAVAQGFSDANGEIRFTDAIAGGGSSGGETVIVLVAGNPILSNLNLTFNSADVNGDLIVDLSDIVLFVQILFSGVYDYRADFNNDGVINLSDIVRFVQAIGAICPP